MNNGSLNAKPDRWQSFIYMGESSHPDCKGEYENHSPEKTDFFTAQSPMTSLATAKVGDRLHVLSLDCSESNNRLIGMGLIPGVVLEVISSRATGSVIVALQDQRLGLSAEMARYIQVTPVTPLSKTDQEQSKNQEQPKNISPTRLSAFSKQSPLKLREAVIGSTLRIVGYEPTARDYKRKLLAMGLTPGTELTVKRHAPLGDPTEIEVRDFHLSLRKAEADALIVEAVTGEAVVGETI